MTNKIGWLLVILSFSGMIQFSHAQTGMETGISFQELHVRNGLPFLSKKVDNRDAVTIAYFGGSITNQDGWRIKSFDWFEERFPAVAFKHVNASIGGTNSQLGAFRVKEHVLKFNPDLVFIEFAVNDDGMSDDRILKSMEGIVRQIWSYQIQCDICFVYTMKESMVEPVLTGEIPHTVKAMERIAEFYAIPSIWFAPEVTRLLANGELIMKGDEESIDGVPVFSPDGVHPYFDTGHEIYAKVFRRAIPELLTEKTNIERRLTEPFSHYNLEEAVMIDPTEIELRGTWETPDKDANVEKFASYMPGMVKASRSGDKAIVKFKGTEIGCFDIMGPGGGRIVVSIDGVVRDTIYRFDKYCTYYRMNNFLINGLENRAHTASFEFNGDPFDKERILRERYEAIKESDSYLEYSWYLGKILLVGKLKNMK